MRVSSHVNSNHMNNNSHVATVEQQKSIFDSCTRSYPVCVQLPEPKWWNESSVSFAKRTTICQRIIITSLISIVWWRWASDRVHSNAFFFLCFSLKRIGVFCFHSSLALCCVAIVDIICNNAKKDLNNDRMGNWAFTFDSVIAWWVIRLFVFFRSFIHSYCHCCHRCCCCCCWWFSVEWSRGKMQKFWFQFQITLTTILHYYY